MIGNVETLNPGDSATASTSVDPEQDIVYFNFGIPKGDKGDTGDTNLTTFDIVDGELKAYDDKGVIYNLGTVAMEPRGEYDAETYYEKLNTVLYNDSTYMAKEPVHGETPSESTKWQLIGGGVRREDIVDNLESNDNTKMLSAKQGKILDGKKPTVYENVASMVADENLKEGMTVQTLGYYEANDGGHGEYVIVDDESLVDDDGSIHVLTNGLRAKLIVDDLISIKQFGAKGDGITDDTQPIQNAIDYGFNHDMPVYVPSTNNFYKITLPLQLYCKRETIGFWDGCGSTIIGENIGNSRIVKIGTLTDNNGNNSTIVAKNQTTLVQQATGITLENLSIENYNDTSYTKNSGYAIWCNISRSNFKNLNIISFNGIIGEMFSSLFENIVFKCKEEALHVTNGTSNRFNFIYAPQCTNPYYISSSYSSLNSVCCDEGTGSIFKLSGMGLSLNECGCESRNAQYIIEILNDYTTLSIRDFYMVRQIGDSENNINLSDCGVIYSTRASIVNIDTFSIAEFNAISSGNSYFFKTTTNCSISTFLKNLRYYKNFAGADNPKLLLWNTNPNGQSPQRFTSQSQDYSYIVSESLKIVPFIGGYQSSNLTDVQGQILNTDNISQNKTIWLDNKTQYTGESGYSNRFLGRRQKGDLQLYNDPLLMNALGLTTTNIVNNYTWDVLEIPIVLRGETSSRPTSNLFIGLQYFDTTLGKPIWYNGTNWVDSTGTQV